MSKLKDLTRRYNAAGKRVVSPTKKQKDRFDLFVDCLVEAVSAEQQKKQRLDEQYKSQKQEAELNERREKEKDKKSVAKVFESLQTKIPEQTNTVLENVNEFGELQASSSASLSAQPQQTSPENDKNEEEPAQQITSRSDENSDESQDNPYVGELQRAYKNARPQTKEQEEETKVKTIVTDQLNREINKIRELFPNFGMNSSSGGGTNAVQYGEGGTMNGDLNVTGKYLSGGIDLSDIFSSTGGTPGLADQLNSGTQAVQLSSNGMLVFKVTNDNIVFTTPLGHSWVFNNAGLVQGPGVNQTLDVVGLDAKTVILSGGINLSDIFVQKGVINGGFYS
jgi:chemotaxis protein histidine kinase CheA